MQEKGITASGRGESTVNTASSFGKTAIRDYWDVSIALASTGSLLFREMKGNKRIVPGSSSSNLKLITVVGALLCLSVVLLYYMDYGLMRLAVVMLKIDLFAFGGGFASLSLMLHQVVSVEGWLDNRTFMDGIALGQITPGPIINTATFVGYALHGFSGALREHHSDFYAFFFDCPFNRANF